ncbi:MAG: imidazoleglycerol-phosphate dehydratase HisB [Campylobacterales bacterium]
MLVTKERITKETSIRLELEIDGMGSYAISTGLGFFDHMLESMAKHALWDLRLECQGDLHIDGHHTVEDVGIVLGQALAEAIYPMTPRERFGDALLVMDETLVQAALDLGGRSFFVYDVKLDGRIGEFDTELVPEFFHALTSQARIALHLTKVRGHNRHHIVEALFKAFAVAMRRALRPLERGGLPSTKGVI